MALHSLPGGRLLSGFGGSIALANWNNPQTGETGAEARPFNETYIDVAEWILREEYLNKRHAISGSYGAMHRRLTAYDWMAQLTIWYEITYPAFTKLNVGSAIEMELHIGYGEAYPDFGNIFSFPHQFKSPWAIVTGVKTYDNSQGYDVVRQEITVEGNALMLYEYDQQVEETYAGYVQRLSGRLPNDF